MQYITKLCRTRRATAAVHTRHKNTTFSRIAQHHTTKKYNFSHISEPIHGRKRGTTHPDTQSLSRHYPTPRQSPRSPDQIALVQNHHIVVHHHDHAVGIRAETAKLGSPERSKVGAINCSSRVGESCRADSGST